MFDLAIKEALCRKKSAGSVYFITDEFSLLPNLRHVDDAVNFGRSLGIKFLIGYQNIEQIADIYGEARAHSLLSGFLTGIFFDATMQVLSGILKNSLDRTERKRCLCQRCRDAASLNRYGMPTL